MLNQFSTTVEKIYAAAAGATDWADALRAIEEYTGSTGAVLNFVPKNDLALPICLAGSFSDNDCAEYAQNYMWRCPRIAFGLSHQDVPIHFDRMILTEYDMDRDATYEWYGKHGLRYYVAGWIGESGTHRAYMSLQRSRRQGHVEPKQVEEFALVVKHMAQALALSVKLGTLDQWRQVGLAVLEGMQHAVFVLGADGAVLATNARADELIAAADGIAIFGRRLRCDGAAQQVNLDRLIHAAISPETDAPRGGWQRIERPSGRAPLLTLVSHFAACESLFSSFEPRALVIIGDPHSESPSVMQMLQETYALTPTEACLASALASGHSLESAAASLGMQVTTARSHLKSIFAKLGVNRQQDLVRLLTSISSISI